MIQHKKKLRNCVKQINNPPKHLLQNGDEDETVELREIKEILLRKHICQEVSDAIQEVSALLAYLETEDKETIISLKHRNFYKILFHNPIFDGKEMKEQYYEIQIGLNFLIVDLAIILLFAGAIYFSAPLWLTAIATGLFVGAFAYLSGILYGVVNDLFATQANLPYFLLGHQEQQFSLLKTNDKIAQAIAWGIYASYGLSLLAVSFLQSLQQLLLFLSQ